MSQSMSKWKQVQGSLYSFFGGKQSSCNKEINRGSETPALTKKTRKYREAWKDKYKWLRLDGKEIKMFCVFCREFPNRKNVQYFLGIGMNNFQQTT